jgi:uncharacterized protein (TIGR02145 family)
MKMILPALVFLTVFFEICGQSKFTDKRDGNVYRTITITGVTWMAENLRYKPKSGALYFENDVNNIQTYGALYDWESAVKTCPAGWHLPSGTEFQDLFNYFEQKANWGKIAGDTLSFGIQLGGMQDYEGTFSEMDESAYYWTSTEYSKNNAEYFSYLLIDDKAVIDISRREDITDIHGTEKSNKYSVRCIKN